MVAVKLLPLGILQHHRHAPQPQPILRTHNPFDPRRRRTLPRDPLLHYWSLYLSSRRDMKGREHYDRQQATQESGHWNLLIRTQA